MNKPKRLGTQWESEVVAYLREQIYPEAERRALAGGTDKGDIINAGPYVWECKNTAAIDLAGGIDETFIEIVNAGSAYGFLIVKRRRKSVAKGYAVMELQQLVQILKELDAKR